MRWLAPLAVVMLGADACPAITTFLATVSDTGPDLAVREIAMSQAFAPRPASPAPAATALRASERGAVNPAALAVAGLLALAPAVAFGQPGPDIAQGQALYEGKCGGCHSLDANRVGPKHRGVVGRKVASVPDYDYSPAIRKLGGVWTPERIDQWLQGPQAMAPGAKMFLQVSDPEQRRAIIAYLAANSASPK
jgi:cytochrome c